MTIMTVDDPMVILMRIKDRLINANNALAVFAQMSADSLETAGEPVKANALRGAVTMCARAVAESNTEFAALLKKAGDHSEPIGLDDRMADPKPGPEWDL